MEVCLDKVREQITAIEGKVDASKQSLLESSASLKKTAGDLTVESLRVPSLKMSQLNKFINHIGGADALVARMNKMNE